MSTLPAGNISSMRRGRPSDYTDEEDHIILQHTSTDECNKELVAHGFKKRTSGALASRRDLLRKKMLVDADLDTLRGLEDELSLLGTIRSGLSKRLDELSIEHDRQRVQLAEQQDVERAAIEARIAEVNARIRGFLAES